MPGAGRSAKAFGEGEQADHAVPLSLAPRTTLRARSPPSPPAAPAAAPRLGQRPRPW